MAPSAIAFFVSRPPPCGAWKKVYSGAYRKGIMQRSSTFWELSKRLANKACNRRLTAMQHPQPETQLFSSLCVLVMRVNLLHPKTNNFVLLILIIIISRQSYPCEPLGKWAVRIRFGSKRCEWERSPSHGCVNCGRGRRQTPAHTWRVCWSQRSPGSHPSSFILRSPGFLRCATLLIP